MGSPERPKGQTPQHRGISQSFFFERRQAGKHGEAFEVTHAEWIGAWRSSPLSDEPGHISRRDGSQHWHSHNLLYAVGEKPRAPRMQRRTGKAAPTTSLKREPQMASTEHGMRTAFYYYRNKAQAEQEPFNLTVGQWIAHWRSSPHHGAVGHMARLYDDMPWSTQNMEFQPGVCPRGLAGAPRREPLGRTLTVSQWVQELRALA